MRSELGVLKRTLLAAALACATAVGTTGAEAAPDKIDVTIDFAKVLRLDQAAHTVVIGNPGIADATVTDDKTLTLTGKTAGQTNLIVLDDSGKEVVNATIVVSSDTRQLTTVYLGRQRETYSCAPVCEQVISVGDDAKQFETATTQIQTRQQFITGQ